MAAASRSLVLAALALMSVGCSALRPGPKEPAWVSLVACGTIERAECLRRAQDAMTMQSPWYDGVALRAIEVREEMTCLTWGTERPMCSLARGWNE